MKKQLIFILRYLSLRLLCNQTIKTIGLILQHNMFDVPIAFFFSFIAS